MNHIDLLSDTIYRQKAIGYLDQLLRNVGKFPVKKSQIYGLRQVARQQPTKLKKFAQHQGKRAHRKQSNASRLQTLKNLQAEIDFWILVFDLCGDGHSGYSVFNIVEPARKRCDHAQSRHKRICNRGNPDEEVLRNLQDEIDFWTCVIERCNTEAPDWSVRMEAEAHLPEELHVKSDMPRKRKQSLRKNKAAHLERWDSEQIPAFFDRFCTHALYYLGMADDSQEE